MSDTQSQTERRLTVHGWSRAPDGEDVWTKDVDESARERMAAASKERPDLGWIIAAVVIAGIVAVVASVRKSSGGK